MSSSGSATRYRVGLGLLAAVVVGLSLTARTSAQCDPVELAKLIAADAAANDQFGHVVALNGDTAVVGSPYDDNAGGVATGVQAGVTLPVGEHDLLLTVTSHTGATGSDTVHVKVRAHDAPATGACCLPDTVCLGSSAADCEAGGGTYQGDDTSCDPNPCSPCIGCGCGPCGAGVMGAVPLTLLGICGLKRGYPPLQIGGRKW